MVFLKVLVIEIWVCATVKILVIVFVSLLHPFLCSYPYWQYGTFTLKKKWRMHSWEVWCSTYWWWGQDERILVEIFILSLMHFFYSWHFSNRFFSEQRMLAEGVWSCAVVIGECINEKCWDWEINSVLRQPSSLSVCMYAHACAYACFGMVTSTQKVSVDREREKKKAIRVYDGNWAFTLDFNDTVIWQ